jgi:RNA polymerase sigma factor (sigma-70 family)
MTPDQEALVLEHDDLAGKTAGAYLRRLPRHIQRDDIVQAARLGLVEAALRWNPARGISFGGFAYRRIRGAIQDELRRQASVSTHTVVKDGKARNRQQAKIDQLSALEDDLGFDVAIPTPCYDQAILLAQVDRHVERLEPRARLAIRASLAGITHRVIAAAFRLTDSRISQLHTAGVRQLRRDLAA